MARSPLTPIRPARYTPHRLRRQETKDRRGSIRDPLRECRANIDATEYRRIVAEYTDEAVSAFSGTGGRPWPRPCSTPRAWPISPVLTSCGRSTAAAWPGDGKLARYVVEIGLCAPKRDVTVRTVQDPDTFRDLLYADDARLPSAAFHTSGP